MCGIHGIINFSNQTPAKEEITEMVNSTKYRGPDDSGIFIHNQVGLGHNRLSIIDLSPAGHNPMVYEHANQRIVITFNGEIYNYQEIKDGLVAKGYTFKSTTDTEVILAAYLEYGYECLKKFNGMFAFVIYDINKNIIFGARDRFGQKPFKYYIDNNKFIFSSELKAILKNKLEINIDLTAIDDFLSLQYVPAPRTGFQEIKKLPPGSYFTLDINNKKFSINKYYELEYKPNYLITADEWIPIIEQNLSQAIKRRLVADVPLGAFLSGGVDSSAIVSLMSQYVNKIKTFTIAFDEKKYDESKYANIVAKQYNTDHTEFHCKSKDLLNYLEPLIHHYEEPYADISALPTFLLSKLTREQVTVALSGDAGDENFGGYEKYRIHLLLKQFKSFLKIASVANKIAPEKLGEFLILSKYPPAKKHYNLTNFYSSQFKSLLFKPEILKELDKENYFEQLIKKSDNNYLNQFFQLDFSTYIPDDINVKVDMASMKNSLEVRAPMLDYEFVNLMSTIPWELKTNIRGGKIIFKKMLSKYLNDDILNRKKHGFSVPIDKWIREDLTNLTKNVILDNGNLSSQLFDKKLVNTILNDHFSNKKNYGKKIWSLIVLNLWYKNNF